MFKLLSVLSFIEIRGSKKGYRLGNFYSIH
jgi:hypothetical protein